MTLTHIVDLNLLDLPPAACIAHIFPALGNTSLLSIGQLCDAGCTATFTADSVHIKLQEKLIIQGTCSLASNCLWTLDLATAPTNTAPSLVNGTSPSAPAHAANSAIANSASPANLVSFAHDSLFSQVLSTLNQALQKNYVTFPGLTAKTLAKYPPSSVTMQKGHLDQACKN
jgi:hypothetical protein